MPHPAFPLALLSLIALCLGACVKQPVQKWPRPLQEIISSGTLELPESLTADSPPALQDRNLLLRYANTADPLQRSAMLQALVNDSNPEKTRTAIAILSIEREKSLRLRIVEALPQMEGEFMDKYKALTGIIISPVSAYMRDAALDAVELLGDPRTLPLWKSLLIDQDPNLRQRAARMVDSLSRPPQITP